MVLLVGRGSSDPDVKRDLTRIGEMLEQRSPVKRVEVCFLTAAKPSFQESLEEAKRSGAKQVFVIPYLFFTGILMGKIEKFHQKGKYRSENGMDSLSLSWLPPHCRRNHL